jgi:hypothetical protein
MILNILIVIGLILIGSYTVLFDIAFLKERNYLGFYAIILLTIVTVGLPVYLLFF